MDGICVLISKNLFLKVCRRRRSSHLFKKSTDNFYRCPKFKNKINENRNWKNVQRKLSHKLLNKCKFETSNWSAWRADYEERTWNSKLILLAGLIGNILYKILLKMGVNSFTNSESQKWGSKFSFKEFTSRNF